MRCELSDLPTDMCEHCKSGRKTLAPLKEVFDITYWRSADYAGRCICGEPFKAGDSIGWDTKKEWWRAEKCCG